MLTDFHHVMVVDAKWAAFSILETAELLLGFLHRTVSTV